MDKMFDDAKTMAEHQNIIITYYKTGRLDRADTIKKYKDFNYSHPEYNTAVNIEGAIFKNASSIETLSNSDIVFNLDKQYRYLTGKSLHEVLQNG